MTFDELLALKWMDGLPASLCVIEDDAVPFDPPDHRGLERSATGPRAHPVMRAKIEAFLKSHGVDVAERVRMFRSRN